MTIPTIRCYQTSADLPGERSARLITDDGTQFAWAARPDDRRGASLIFDGLAATGVNWRVNPPLRVDIRNDGAHLAARLRVRGTKLLIITNAHYLVPPVRQTAINLAADVGADLVFSYEDGHGTTLHSSGLLDDADKYGWPCHPDDRPPFIVPEEPVEVEPATQTDSGTAFPAVIATVGFGLFRAWNRELLAPDQFTQLDRLYCDVYRHTREHTDPDTAVVARLAHQHLNQPTRAQALTALRAMQAALFRNGILWRLPLSSLDAWRESPDSVTATDRDYQRLTELNDAQTAAIAVLASLNIPFDAMRGSRLNSTTITSPDIAATPAPDTALFVLRVAAELNGGPLITRSQRDINYAIRFLTQQFGFPLPVTRGPRETRRALMHPDYLHLIEYRKDTE
ncbi:MAG: hypothetical protein M9886_02895 [Candidatus Nanopelagicales bacterium]|nr:hypothetical protein [Candidatus Nanopelagicales bacterium]